MYRHLKNGDDCARLATSGGLMYQMNKNLLARAKMSKHLSTPLLGTSDSSGSALHAEAVIDVISFVISWHL